VHPATKARYVSGYPENVIVHHGIVDASLAFLARPYTLPALARKIRAVPGGG
jgi:hypothetical protein